MPRETSEITARDLKLITLRKEIFKVIKSPLAWNKFKEYIDPYYKKNTYRGN